MFQIFRKNQKVLMACTVLFAIFAFTFGDFFNQIAGRANLSDYERAVVQIDGKAVPIMFSEFQAAASKRAIANNFVQRATGFPNAFGPTDRDEAILEAVILAKKADKFGIVLAPEETQEWIRQLGLSTERFVEISQGYTDSSGAPLDDSQVIDLISEQLRLQRVRQLELGMFVFSSAQVTPYESWDYYKRINERFEFEVITVKASEYTEEISDPDESDLQKLFDQYSGVLPDPNSPDPGFREPRKLKIAYATGSIDDFVARFKDKVTDEEIKTYYEEKKDLYRELPAMSPDETKKDESDPEDPKKSETKKADPKQGEPKKSETKKADPKQGEPKKAETKKADPKQGEPKKSETKKADPKQGEPKESETKKADPKQGEPKKSETKKADPKQGEPKNEETKKADPKQGEPKNEETETADPKQGDPKKVDPKQEGSEKEDESDEGCGPFSAQEASQEGKSEKTSDADAAKQSQDQGKEKKAAAAKSDESKSKASKSKASKSKAPKSESPKSEPGKQETPEKKDTTTPGAAQKGTSPSSTATKDNEKNSTSEDPTKKTPQVPEPTYKPLEEVRDEIIDRISRDKANEALQEQVFQFETLLGDYRRVFVEAKDQYDEEKEIAKQESREFNDKFVIPQPEVDFAAKAKELGLTYVELDPMSIEDLASSSTFKETFEVQEFNPFGKQPAEVLPGTYEFDTRRFRNLSDQFFVVWKLDDAESRIQSFEEARPAVLASYKIREAEEKAKAAAEKIAEGIKSMDNDMEKYLKANTDIGSVTVPLTPLWSAAPNLNQGFMGPADLRGTEIQGVEMAGATFREAVAKAKSGEIVVAPNTPRTSYYVVKLVGRQDAKMDGYAAWRTFGESLLQRTKSQETMIDWARTILAGAVTNRPEPE